MLVLYQEYCSFAVSGRRSYRYDIALSSSALPEWIQSGKARVVNISFTRQLRSELDTESYSAAKGGLTALPHAMAVTLAGKAWVNAIVHADYAQTGASSGFLFLT